MSFNTYLLYILIPGAEIGYNELVPVFRNVITALIWIPYFITSVRVKERLSDKSTSGFIILMTEDAWLY